MSLPGRTKGEYRNAKHGGCLMSTEVSYHDPVQALPPDVDRRLAFWHGLWSRSARYHYFFGVVSVGASVISTSLDGGPAKVFSIIAAIATALIGFMHPERRYMKFVRAWRVLDVAAMRYRHGLSDKAALIDAVERGEALIADFEDKIEAAAVEQKAQQQASTQTPAETPSTEPPAVQPQDPAANQKPAGGTAP
jgi:hypothetical protein